MQEQKPSVQGIQNNEPQTIKPGPPPVDNSKAGQPAESSAESLEDTELEKAVDDIAAKEADEILKAEDKELENAFASQPKTLKEKIKALIQKWWDNPRSRWSTIGGVIAIIVILSIVPGTRYFMLNTVGIRASASITVLDSSTKLPLKNVKVSLAGKSGSTNSDGQVRLSKLKVGGADLLVEKRAFESVKKKVTLGWGSNPLDETSLKPVGVQYIFSVKDYLSEKGIAKAEAIYNDANAISDDEGTILLTVDNSQLNDDQNFKVTIKADGYRDGEVEVAVGSKDRSTVVLVSARKEVFVTKRSGKYDLYKVDIDGKNEELILPGTGSERPDMTIVNHPKEEIVAFVSTRDNIRNKDSYLLSSLDVINLKDNTKFTIAQSEKIQIIGWHGDNLIFVQIAAGASAADPRRHRLVSYDSKTAGRLELASSNYFNDLHLAQGVVYYAASSAFMNDQTAKFYKVNADGSNRQVVIEKEVFNIFRKDYDTFYLAAGDWYEYKTGTTATKKLSGEPANLGNRVYVDSNDKKHSLWSDVRDGKGVLLNIDTSTKTDKILHSQSGLGTPYRWLTDKIAIFRVRTASETADYAISLDGGPAKKIRDVTHTAGLEQWYYY